jgi:hypothetical protein
MTIDFRIPMPRGRGPGQSPRLLEYFNKEKRGSWRSDICRVADLYLKGGYYMDNDMRAVRAIVFQITFSSRCLSNEQNFSSPGQHAWESICKALDVMLGFYDKHTIADRRLVSQYVRHCDLEGCLQRPFEKTHRL